MSQQDLPDASWSGTNLALFFLVFLTGTELFEISGLIKLVKKSHGQPETEPCFLTLPNPVTEEKKNLRVGRFA